MSVERLVLPAIDLRWGYDPDQGICVGLRFLNWFRQRIARPDMLRDNPEKCWNVRNRGICWSHGGSMMLTIGAQRS